MSRRSTLVRRLRFLRKQIEDLNFQRDLTEEELVQLRAVEAWAAGVGGEPETGKTLTVLGENCGVRREAGESDDDYRARIVKVVL